MEMDKRTILAILLIVVIMLLTPYYMDFMGYNQTPEVTTIDSLSIDSLTHKLDSVDLVAAEKSYIHETAEKSEPVPKTDRIFSENSDSLFLNYKDTVIYQIETPLIKIELTNKKGGNIKKWELKNYEHYKQPYVNLIDDNYFDFSFVGENGKNINTSSVIAEPYNNANKTRFILNEDSESLEFTFLLKTHMGGSIYRIFVIHPDKYHVDIIQRFDNIADYFHGNFYDYKWMHGIPLVEENLKDDLGYNGANVYMGEELEYIDADDEDQTFDFNGKVDWTAIRNKYFSIYMKAFDIDKTEGVQVESFAKSDNENVTKNRYNNTIIFKNSRQDQYSDSLLIYLGPLDYRLLKKYESEFENLVMNRNWYERYTRPIALVMLPIFSFLYKYIGNYGFVIIVFSILLKLILYPLTKKSYQSMKEMALLQPIISELREKYKDNPQKMNKELMGIYKKHGVNPMGGCLPNLLQMPILFAMFSLFRSTIQLRGQEFIFWIKDLSAPDVVNLGFNLPLLGSTIHILPILSSVTMIFQSKQTSTDPKNKALVYMMPVMMLVFLYNFPSGLHLYYFVFNIFSFLQQKMIKEPVPLNEREKQKISKMKKKK